MMGGPLYKKWCNAARKLILATLQLPKGMQAWAESGVMVGTFTPHFQLRNTISDCLHKDLLIRTPGFLALGATGRTPFPYNLNGLAVTRGSGFC